MLQIVAHDVDIFGQARQELLYFRQRAEDDQFATYVNVGKLVELAGLIDTGDIVLARCQVEEGDERRADTHIDPQIFSRIDLSRRVRVSEGKGRRQQNEN